ncbi:MAG TPA: hypothetical protein VII45_10215 [Solirubrobacterales bacterium]
MSLLPLLAVHSRLQEDLPGARAWAERHEHDFDWDEEALRLRLSLKGPDAEAYLLEGTFEDFPTLPPSWRFLDPRTAERIGPPAYPTSAEPSPRGTALIINGGTEGVVICAHFNRLAFTEEGGIHGDWGPLANWQNQAGDYTYANTVADMLARIALEVSDSTGRKAALP